MDANKNKAPNKAQSYIHLLQKLSILLYNTRLYYGLNNPVVAKESSEVLAEIENATLKKETLTFSVLGNTMFVNGEKLELRDGLSRQFMANLAKLSLGALDLTPGLTANELSVLMLLLINNTNLKGKDQIKAFLDEHNAKHIIPHLATYQLVHENEQVVKEGSVIDVDKLSSKIINSFSSDLKHAAPIKKPSSAPAEDINKYIFSLTHNITENKTPNINKEEQNKPSPITGHTAAGAGILSPDPSDHTLHLGVPDRNQPSPEVFNSFSADLKNGIINDKTLLRNQDFLRKVLTALAPTINTFEELLKIIWAVGACLIDDISVAKEIEANHNILLQIKGHLLSQYEQKENKEQWKTTIEESFVSIITALQIKKHLLLYKKHKRGIEVVLKKIKSWLEDTPAENKLYKQIKKELQEIGAPKVDNNMFV